MLPIKNFLAHPTFFFSSVVPILLDLAVDTTIYWEQKTNLMNVFLLDHYVCFLFFLMHYRGVVLMVVLIKAKSLPSKVTGN